MYLKRFGLRVYLFGWFITPLKQKRTKSFEEALVFRETEATQLCDLTSQVLLQQQGCYLTGSKGRAPFT